MNNRYTDKAMIHFLSFADSRMKPSLQRIKKEAEVAGWFDTVTVFDEHCFEKSYLSIIRQTLHMRGFGYWRWKSYVVLKKLKELQWGDILVYCDAGCEINSLAKTRFFEYIDLVKENQSGLLFFEQESNLVKQWTKMDLIIYADGDADKSVLSGNIFLIRKTNQSKDFVEKWYDLCNNHFDLITDSPSIIPNDPSFIENRHDQSALSVIGRKYDPVVLSDLETWTSGDFKQTLSSFPFWATRNKQFDKWQTRKMVWRFRLIKMLGNLGWYFRCC